MSGCIFSKIRINEIGGFAEIDTNHWKRFLTVFGLRLLLNLVSNLLPSYCVYGNNAQLFALWKDFQLYLESNLVTHLIW